MWGTENAQAYKVLEAFLNAEGEQDLLLGIAKNTKWDSGFRKEEARISYL